MPEPREYPPIEESPGYAEYQDARALRDQGRLASATRSALAAIRENPERVEFHALAGEIYVRQGNLVSAQQAYQKGLEEDPGNAELWHNLGMVNHRLSAFDFAERSLKNAILIDPDSVRSHYQLGLTLYRMANVVVGAESLDRERMGAAREQFERAAELDPSLVEPYLWAGIASKQLGDYERATAHFESVLALEPDHLEAHVHLAESWLQRGDAELCRQYYERALALDPTSARAHVGLARLDEFEGDLEAARASYEAAIAADPRFAEAYYGLSQVYLRLGLEAEASEAQRTYEELEAQARREREAEAAEVTERRVQLLYETAIGLEMEGQRERAEELYRDVLEIDPENAKTLTQLGQMLRDRGDLETAVEYFRRAHRSDAGNARARRLLIETEQLLEDTSTSPGGAEAGS